jgi:hypothetical protein
MRPGSSGFASPCFRSRCVTSHRMYSRMYRSRIEVVPGLTSNAAARCLMRTFSAHRNLGARSVDIRRGSLSRSNAAKEVRQNRARSSISPKSRKFPWSNRASRLVPRCSKNIKNAITARLACSKRDTGAIACPKLRNDNESGLKERHSGILVQQHREALPGLEDHRSDGVPMRHARKRPSRRQQPTEPAGRGENSDLGRASSTEGKFGEEDARPSYSLKWMRMAQSICPRLRRNILVETSNA